jgi:hypothetical protein
MAEQAFKNFQQSVEKIERVEKVDPSKSTAEILPTEEVSAADKAKFAEAVNKAETKWDSVNPSPKTTLVAAEDPVQKLSPIDQMSMGSNKIERLKPVTVDQIVQQADDLRARIQAPISKIEEAQKTTPDLRLSPAHDAQLTDKLIHVDTSLKTALNKVGVEVTAQEIHQTSGQAPLFKFLNYLSNSDRHLYTLVGEINSMQNSKERLTPEKLLAVQIKLGFVQNELEFFTNVLNKALEGTKTIMNVQV